MTQAEKLAESLEKINKKGLSQQGLETIAKRFHEIGAAAQKAEQRLSGKTSRSSWISTLSDELKQAAKGEQDLTRIQGIISRQRVRTTRDETREYMRAWEQIRERYHGTKFAKAGLESIIDSRHSALRAEVLKDLGIEQNNRSQMIRRAISSGSIPGVMRNAAANAAESGGGLARIAGWAGVGALGYGALNLIQGAFGQFGNARDEAIGNSDLRRSLGLTASDFDELRMSIRGAVSGFGVAFNESQKLAEQFARTSGVVGSPSAVAEGVRVSAGFARGYGISPAMSAQFFGTATRFGDNNNRRLALMIGESVGKSNLSSRLPDVLSSLSSYLSTAATASLSAPNSAEFLSMLWSLTTLGVPGLKGNPAGSAAIMSTVDTSLRRGGGFGEASKNFTLGLYSQLAPGFSAFDLDLVNAQGAFGTFAGAFGPNSPAYQMAQSQMDTGLMRHYAGLSKIPGTILGHHMSGLKSRFGGDSRGLLKAVMGHFQGLSGPQAAALIAASEATGGFGGLYSQLQAAGVDVDGMSTINIAQLAEINYGDTDTIQRHKHKLLAMGGLTEQERLSLTSGSLNDQKNAILKLSSLYDPKDQGDRAREAQIDMANEMQKLVTELLPAVNVMKEGIIEIVRFISGIFGTKSQLLETLDEQSRMKDFQSQISPGDGEQKAKMHRMVEYLAQDRDLKLTRAQAAGIVGNLSYESGRFKQLQELNPLKGRGGYGYAQWTGPRRQSFLQWAQQNHLERSTEAANLGFLKHELLTSESDALAALRDAGTVNEATRVFMDQYERPGIKNLSARQREAIIAASGINDTMSTKMPPEARRQAARSNTTVDHRVKFYDQKGDRELAPPLLINQNSAPVAAGMN